MAAVLRSSIVASVRSYGHLEHLTHITDADLKQRCDRSYRRLRALLDAARGQEIEKRQAFARVEAGERLILLPSDFYQLRGLLLQRSTYVEAAV